MHGFLNEAGGIGPDHIGGHVHNTTRLFTGITRKDGRGIGSHWSQPGSLTRKGGVAVGGMGGAVADGQLRAVDVQRPRAGLRLVNCVKADSGHLNRAVVVFRAGGRVGVTVRVWGCAHCK